MKTTIQIKTIYGYVLYEHTCDDNSMKKTVEESIKNKNPLCGADLCDADLRYANLSGADLSNVKANYATAMFFPQCPDGEFIGYKKAEEKIVKLLIPEDAKRSSGTTLKCRCSKATVLEIQELDGSPSSAKEVRSNYNKDFVYCVGETVCVEEFDDYRWNECSRGIHFFISREAAVSYED